MKTPTHTPAPWKVAGLSLNNHEAFVIESDTQTICWTANGIENDEEFVSAEDQANALLIAAAPDLLAICEEIANDSKCDLVNSERRIRLYSALAKAKGERIK